MAFYLIGLGLNEKSLGKEALEVLGRCKKVYLEGYTIDFPYSFDELREEVGEFDVLKREDVESEEFLDNAKKEDVALLVYGSPLVATTHMQLIERCRRDGIYYRVFHNASILDAISECGLEIYKFGKITSIPNWKEHTNKPTSFVEYLKDNLSVSAHTLLLVDIGMDLGDALDELDEACSGRIDLNKVIVVSRAGTESRRILYKEIEEMKRENVEKPFCIIVPGKMNSFEKEFLESSSRQI